MPPRYLRKDYLAEILASNGKKVPPHRWLVVGPKRSGFLLRENTIKATYFNTNIVGSKRWVLIPESSDYSYKFVSKDAFKNMRSDEAIHYFKNVLPKLKNLKRLSGDRRIPKIIEGI